MPLTSCVFVFLLLIVSGESSTTATAQKPDQTKIIVLQPDADRQPAEFVNVVKGTSLLIVCTQSANSFSSPPVLTVGGIDVAEDNTTTFGQVDTNSSTVSLFISAFHGSQHALLVECSSLAKSGKHVARRFRLHEQLPSLLPDGFKLCDPGNPLEFMCQNSGRCLTDIKTDVSQCQCTEPRSGLHCERAEHASEYGSNAKSLGLITLAVIGFLVTVGLIVCCFRRRDSISRSIHNKMSCCIHSRGQQSVRATDQHPNQTPTHAANESLLPTRTTTGESEPENDVNGIGEVVVQR